MDRVRRTHERLPSNGFIERDASSLTLAPIINERVASDKTLTLLGHIFLFMESLIFLITA
jgi:hypothetical protein